MRLLKIRYTISLLLPSNMLHGEEIIGIFLVPVANLRYFGSLATCCILYSDSYTDYRVDGG